MCRRDSVTRAVLPVLHTIASFAHLAAQPGYSIKSAILIIYLAAKLVSNLNQHSNHCQRREGQLPPSPVENESHLKSICYLNIQVQSLSSCPAGAITSASNSALNTIQKETPCIRCSPTEVPNNLDCTSRPRPSAMFRRSLSPQESERGYKCPRNLDIQASTGASEKCPSSIGLICQEKFSHWRRIATTAKYLHIPDNRNAA